MVEVVLSQKDCRVCDLWSHTVAHHRHSGPKAPREISHVDTWHRTHSQRSQGLLSSLCFASVSLLQFLPPAYHLTPDRSHLVGAEI